MTQPTEKLRLTGKTITIYQRPDTREQKAGAAGFIKEYVINPGNTATLAQAVKFDNCPAKYNGGYRTGENFQSANCILADIDNSHSDDSMD